MVKAWSNTCAMARSRSISRRPRASRSPLSRARASKRLTSRRGEQRLDFLLQRRIEARRVLHHHEVAHARHHDGAEFRQHLADAGFVDGLAEIGIDRDDGYRDVLERLGEVVFE